MNKVIIFISLLFISLLHISFNQRAYRNLLPGPDSLRAVYSKPTNQWPKPEIDAGIKWEELGVLPPSPLAGKMDSLKNVVELGKVLFYDPRLSGSNQISCISCHAPETAEKYPWGTARPPTHAIPLRWRTYGL
jgi:cytochrome c peroxidase